MRVSKLFVSVALVLGLLSVSFGQISVSSGNLVTSGTYTFETTGTPVTFSSGSSGANQTWNFGAFTWAGTTTDVYLTPSSTPHGSAFPTATRCRYTTGFEEEGIYEYERIASNGIFYLGTAAADTAMPLSTESQFAPLPYTYPNTWTVLMRFEANIGGFPMSTVDSIIQTCDGWGTVNTPYGNYPCLRIFRHMWISSYLAGQLVYSSQSIGYSWVNQQGIEVVTVSGGDNVTDPNFTTGIVDILESTTSAEPVRGPVASHFALEQNYPNPFNPTTTLPYTMEKPGRVQFQVYDETGRLVHSEEFESAAGTHNLPIDGSQWSTGTYFARLATGSQAQTTKMVLIK